jgi:hypothetical protein
VKWEESVGEMAAEVCLSVCLSYVTPTRPHRAHTKYITYPSQHEPVKTDIHDRGNKQTGPEEHTDSNNAQKTVGKIVTAVPLIETACGYFSLKVLSELRK